VYFDQTEQIELDVYDFVVLSPGPKHPNDASQSLELLRRLDRRVPVLGVCLGFQLLAVYEGMHISEVPSAHHGAVKEVSIDTRSIMGLSLPETINVASYNSLGLTIDNFNKSKSPFNLVAKSADGMVEAFESKENPFMLGIQFHPESFLSEYSEKMIRNFLAKL
jgi:anthranilate synthase/aminodeoxychorismate synthase-like glutamine amidotransferase